MLDSNSIATAYMVTPINVEFRWYIILIAIQPISLFKPDSPRKSDSTGSDSRGLSRMVRVSLQNFNHLSDGENDTVTKNDWDWLLNSMIYGQLFPKASDAEKESLRRLGRRWKVRFRNNCFTRIF